MAETSKKTPGRPKKSDAWTVEDLEAEAEKYFARCDNHTKIVAAKDGPISIPDPIPYTIEGLCNSLGILRQTFFNWRKSDGPLSFAANFLHQKITADRVEGALMGRQNASFSQFLLKNTNPDEYRDKVELESNVAEDVKSILETWSQSWKPMQ